MGAPIFLKTFDFISLLFDMTEQFPNTERLVIITERLLNAGLKFQELLIEANACNEKSKQNKINSAKAELNKIRIYLNLALRWKILARERYSHVNGQMVEITNLLIKWKAPVRVNLPN